MDSPGSIACRCGCSISIVLKLVQVFWFSRLSRKPVRRKPTSGGRPRFLATRPTTKAKLNQIETVNMREYLTGMVVNAGYYTSNIWQ